MSRTNHIPGEQFAPTAALRLSFRSAALISWSAALLKVTSKVMVAALPVENPIEWTLTRAEDGKSFSVVYEGESDGVNILTYLAIKGWLPK